MVLLFGHSNAVQQTTALFVLQFQSPSSSGKLSRLTGQLLQKTCQSASCDGFLGPSAVLIISMPFTTGRSTTSTVKAANSPSPNRWAFALQGIRPL